MAAPRAPLRYFVVGMLRRRLLIPLATLVAVLALPAVAGAAERTMKFRFGPIVVTPGQNDILFSANDKKPQVPGWITSFKPDLVYKDGTPTRTDVIHLHHGVWLKNGYPQFAAGEEKSIIDLPPGYGWRSLPSDRWIMNHMIHNLTPNPAEVYLTYEVGFIPDTDPAAAGITHEVQTKWLDVMGLRAWPVFDAIKGAGGKDKRFTYPDEVPGYTPEKYPFNRWTVEQDGALVGTVGHLHPGGLYTDLRITRGGRTITVFRSEAKYFEPAGAVSWDVALTRTPQNWRVAVRKGDVVSVHATYDTSRASWYESMGIMPLAWEPGGQGTDPFATQVPTRGKVTHGPLQENRNHGGGPFGLPDPRKLPDGRALSRGAVKVTDFLYDQGDLKNVGRALRPPTIPAGKGLTFINRDATKNIMHTITACKAPCNRETGIAYPLADANVAFDSGNLGYGPAGRTAATNTDRWSTPKNLRPGTYTYFCRVHPFMRGSFRVKARQ